jgi:hypothetical protein
VTIVEVMSTQSSTASGSILSAPTHPVGYLAILAALVTGILHLFLGPQVMGFSQLLGTLFILNGLGFLGGIGLYLSRYWRRELYLLTVAYALVTIIALFAFQGFSVEAFYRQGSLNPMAVVSKAAELVLAVCAGYLYTATGR